MANRMQATSPSTGKPSASRQAAGAVPQAASDHLYGVVSVLYHALQGAQAYQQYISDSKKANAPELQQFFEQCRKEEHQRAQRAKAVLSDLLDDESEERDAEYDEAVEAEDAEDDKE